MAGEEETKAKGQAVSTDEQGRQARGPARLSCTQASVEAKQEASGASVTSPYGEMRSFPKTKIWDSKSEQAQGGGMDWEFGISRCQLVYVGLINNKVLPYSTGNYICYPGTNHDGKEYKKEYIYMHIHN